MDDHHLHEVRGVRHIPRGRLIKTKTWNVMREMSSTDNSAITRSRVVTQRPEAAVAGV